MLRIQIPCAKGGKCEGSMASMYSFPNLFSKGNYPAEGFGYVSTVIYITACVSGCCLQLVHAQHPLAGACRRGRLCKNVFPDRTRIYSEK